MFFLVCRLREVVDSFISRKEVAPWKKNLVSSQESRNSIISLDLALASEIKARVSRSIRHVCVLVSTVADDSSLRLRRCRCRQQGAPAACGMTRGQANGNLGASKDRPTARSLFARRRLHNGPRSIQYATSDAGRKRDAPNRHAYTGCPASSRRIINR